MLPHGTTRAEGHLPGACDIRGRSAWGLDRYVTFGATPRASIALVVGGRALAFLRGRDYVLPHDVGEWP